MFFKAINRNLDPPQLKIKNGIIDQVNQFNFLGVHIDQRLKWNDHINHVSMKVSRANGILSRLKHFIPKHVLQTIYHVIISPHLNYGNLLWGFNCNRIIRIQKKSIRIINNARFNSHTEPLFKRCNILKLTDMVTLRQLIFYEKMCNAAIPNYFKSFMPTLQSQIHDYPTRGKSNPRAPIARTQYQRNTLRYQISILIGSTPAPVIANIGNQTSETFKFNTKKRILDAYEEHCLLMNCYICQHHPT